MENGTLSASDVAMLAGNNDGFGNGWGGMIWLFAILALMGGGFGNWGNNNFANAIGYENLATSNEVQRGFDNQNSMANQREILAAVNGGTAQAVAATNQTFHDTLGALNDKYGELQRDIAALAVGQANALANQNACCCETKQLIMQGNYENALALAGLEQRLTSKLDQNEITALRDKVQSLELAQATDNVVRYPNSWAYNAGPSPFCGCNQGCGCPSI